MSAASGLSFAPAAALFEGPGVNPDFTSHAVCSVT